MRVGTQSVADMWQTSTGYFQIASGTTGQRPKIPSVGMMRFNTSFQNYEYYANGAWLQCPNSKFDADRAPASQDASGYATGSTWFWGTRIFICVDASPGAASWVEVATSANVPTNHPGISTGRYYSAALDGMMSTATFADGTMYAIPCQFPAGYTFNRIGVETITRHTNYNIRLGIYSNLDGAPNKLLLDAGLVSASTVGPKEIITNFTSDGDWFWLVCTLQTDMTLRSMQYTTALLGTGPIGMSPLGRLESGGPPIMRVQGTQAYGALPAAFPAVKTASTTDAPYLWLRKV